MRNGYIKHLTNCATFVARGTKFDWQITDTTARADVKSSDEGEFYVEFDGNSFKSNHPICKAYFRQREIPTDYVPTVIGD